MAFPVLRFTALARAILAGLPRTPRKCCHIASQALHWPALQSRDAAHDQTPPRRSVASLLQLALGRDIRRRQKFAGLFFGLRFSCRSIHASRAAYGRLPPARVSNGEKGRAARRRCSRILYVRRVRLSDRRIAVHHASQVRFCHRIQRRARSGPSWHLLGTPTHPLGLWGRIRRRLRPLFPYGPRRRNLAPQSRRSLNSCRCGVLRHTYHSGGGLHSPALGCRAQRAPGRSLRGSGVARDRLGFDNRLANGALWVGVEVTSRDRRLRGVRHGRGFFGTALGAAVHQFEPRSDPVYARACLCVDYVLHFIARKAGQPSLTRRRTSCWQAS